MQHFQHPPDFWIWANMLVLLRHQDSVENDLNTPTSSNNRFFLSQLGGPRMFPCPPPPLPPRMEPCFTHVLTLECILVFTPEWTYVFTSECSYIFTQERTHAPPPPPRMEPVFTHVFTLECTFVFTPRMDLCFHPRMDLCFHLRMQLYFHPRMEPCTHVLPMF